jgi:hypothetical protein
MSDIVSSQKIRTINESNQYVHDPEKKRYYMYDYYIQLNLSTVNGKALKKMLTRRFNVIEGKEEVNDDEKDGGEVRRQK